MSFQLTVMGPTVMLIGFHVVSPFSMFKPVGVISTLVGSLGCLVYSLHEEFDDISRRDKGELGQMVRYRYQQLSAFDGLKMSYKKETQVYMKRKGQKMDTIGDIDPNQLLPKQ